MNTAPGPSRRLFTALCVLSLVGAGAEMKAFTLGDAVEANTEVYVRQSPAGLVNGLQAGGSGGYLALGPVLAAFNGTNDQWWFVIFSIAPNGWVAESDLTVIPPAAPVLASPGSASSPGSTIANGSPTMSWNPVIGATGYALYVYDVTKGSLVYSNNSLSNVTSVAIGPLSLGNTFQWTVQASDSAGFGPASAPLYFQSPSLAPASPILNSPGTFSSPGPTITNVYPVLNWNPSGGATNYGLYVYDITASSMAYSNDTVGDITTVTLPVGLKPGHHYRWDACASNAGGFGDDSDFFYFVEQLPVLAIASQGPGSVSIPVSGVSPGLTVVLQASRDLQTWTPLQTNGATGTTLSLSPAANPALPAEFFRVTVK